MTTNPTPAPIDYKTASALKRELCRALGWEPGNVRRIEVQASYFKITDREGTVYTMTTQNLATSEWTPKSVSYGHAAELAR